MLQSFKRFLGIFKIFSFLDMAQMVEKTSGNGFGDQFSDIRLELAVKLSSNLKCKQLLIFFVPLLGVRVVVSAADCPPNHCGHPLVNHLVH